MKQFPLKCCLRYPGGKSKALKTLAPWFPTDVKEYREPFIGGGALLFELLSSKWMSNAVISDANKELITTYCVVKENVEELIKALNKHKNEKEYYYKIRSISLECLNDIEIAARFIYLNKCGFNGLYRVNSSGKFNVPFGNNPKAVICNEDVLRRASLALQGVKIINEDFECVLAGAQEGDVVYCDPPYIPLSATSIFTSYTKNGFDLDEQIRLRNLALNLRNRF